MSWHIFAPNGGCCLCIEISFTDYDCVNTKLKDKQQKQRTGPKSHKTEIKILFYPQLV